MTTTLPTPIKIKFKSRNTTFISTDLVSTYTTKPGQLVIANSSRIHSDRLLPSLYLGTDPKNGKKHYFLCLPALFVHVPSIEDEFNVFGSLSTRVLRINWEVEDFHINRIIHRVSEMITGQEGDIDLDKLIEEEMNSGK